MQIGMPGYNAASALLLWPALAPNQTAALTRQLARSSYSGMTGANLVWEASNVMFRAVLAGNLSEATAAVAACHGEIVLAPGTAEGMKADNSFFQHGNQLYSGGYGQSFAYDVTNLLALVAGTPLAFPPALVDLFGTWLAYGSLRMIVYGAAGPRWDLSVVGRDLTRPFGSSLQFGFGQSGQQVSFVAAALAGVGGAAAGELDLYAAVLNGSAPGPPAPALGFVHFHQADYALATRANWTSSLRMQSARTLRSECVNDEGIRSLHLADGAAYIYLAGDEYEDVQPAWDWEQIPGTAVRAGAAALSCNDVQGSSASVATGGTGDGASGAAMQRFIAPVHQNLTLDRVHGFFARALPVRLANVTAASPTFATLDSRRMRGDVWAGAATDPVGSARLLPPGDYSFAAGDAGAPGWLWHDGVGYVVAPPPAAAGGGLLRVSAAAAATGAWASIGQAIEYGNVTVPLLTVWLEFAAPAGALAEWVTVPAIGLADFQSALAANGAGAFGGSAGGEDWGAAWGACAEGPGAGQEDEAPCAAVALFAAGAAAAVAPPAASGVPAFSASCAGSSAALLVRFGAASVRVAGAGPDQEAWSARVETGLAFVASAGCEAGGAVVLAAPPKDGSSQVVDCVRA